MGCGCRDGGLKAAAPKKFKLASGNSPRPVPPSGGGEAGAVVAALAGAAATGLAAWLLNRKKGAPK